VGLQLSDVVKVDVLLRDVWNIPIMEKVFKHRFKGKYPARKTISTEFAHVGCNAWGKTRAGRIQKAIHNAKAFLTQ
jgi:enamine deaminase RidA (YjgF/YER057c/UK114 family)